MLSEDSGRLMDLREVEELLNATSSSPRNKSTSAPSLLPPQLCGLLNSCFGEGELEGLMASSDEGGLQPLDNKGNNVDKDRVEAANNNNNVEKEDEDVLVATNEMEPQTDTVYVKNWFISVEEIGENDCIASILSPSLTNIAYWIVLRGTIVKSASDLPVSTVPHIKSTWILRVLTENCVQAVDGTIYTLLGGMDIISSGFSDSSFDTGIFENGFGSNDHEWKERVLQILGLDTTSSTISDENESASNTNTISNSTREKIVNQDLWLRYKNETTFRPASLTSTTSSAADLVPELIQESAQSPSLADTDQKAPVHIENPIAPSTTTTTFESENASSLIPTTTAITTTTTAVKKNSKNSAEPKKAKKSAGPSVKKAVEKKKAASSSVSVKKKSVKPIAFSKHPKATPSASNTTSTEKKLGTISSSPDSNSSPRKRRVSFSDKITSPPPKMQRTERSSPRFLESSPDILVSRSGRLSKKPSEWWVV